jgi:hypothetical protein
MGSLDVGLQEGAPGNRADFPNAVVLSKPTGTRTRAHGFHRGGLTNLAAVHWTSREDVFPHNVIWGGERPTAVVLE